MGKQNARPIAEFTAEKLVDRLEALLAENEHLREVTKMMPKWISVSERLPESEGMVLVTFTGKIQNKEYIGGYLLAEYVPGDGWILEEYPRLENPNVTHWCELPEPPSTEGGGVNGRVQTLQVFGWMWARSLCAGIL